MNIPFWSVYLLHCPPLGKRLSPSIYTGITNDFPRRLKEHLTGKGAKYTRANPPDSGVVVEANLTMPQALRLEYRLKSLKPADKLKMFIYHKSLEVN